MVVSSVASPEAAASALVHEDERSVFVQQGDGLHERATTRGSVAGVDVDVH